MNKYNAASFEKIKKAADEYRACVTRTLDNYAAKISAAQDESKAYKDEQSIFAGKKAAAVTYARNAIALAENAFTGTVKGEIEQLRDELHRHLVTAPSEKFLAALGVYATYNLAPGKEEVSALVEQAGGNSLALRALDAVLQKTGAKWRVDVPGAADFEADIAKLERLGEGHLMYRPDGHHVEACAVFEGTPRLLRTDAGEYRDAGYTWGSVNIITASADFNHRISELEGMSQRWTESVLPTVFDAETYKGHKDKATGAEISGEQEYIEDYTATAQAGEIVENGDAGAMIAAEQAKQRAAADARAREVLAYYAGKAGA